MHTTDRKYRHEYKNPWHRRFDNWSGPEVFQTNSEPVEYKGYLIFEKNSVQWDVVKDGVCISQLAGPNGARQKIDQIIDMALYTKRVNAIIKKHGLSLKLGEFDISNGFLSNLIPAKLVLDLLHN